MDPGKQREFAQRKIDLQKGLAQVDIDMTREQLKTIAAATQQQTSQITIQIDQVEQQIAKVVNDKKSSKLSLKRIEKEISELEDDEDLPDDIKIKRRQELNAEKDKRKTDFDTKEDELSKLIQQKKNLLTLWNLFMKL